MSVIPGHGAAGDQVAKAMEALNKTPATATPEPATVVTPDHKAPQDDQASRAFQVLAKKEKQMLMRHREFKQREAEMLKREEIIKRHEQLEAEGKKNPMAILQALGWDYDKLTQHQLNGGQMTPEMIAQAATEKVNELERRLQEDEQRRTQEQLDAAKAAQAEVTQGFKEEITDFISANADEYEYIQHFGMEDLVYETIQENFVKTKKIMSIEDASKLVEKFLEEEEVEKLTKAKKFQKKFASTEAPEEVRIPGKAPFTPSPTLNNKTTVSTTSTTLPARTEQDRIQRALAALDRK